MSTSDYSQSAIESLELIGAGEAYRDEIANLLENSGYLFREFEWAQIQMLAGYMGLYRAPKGATIFSEGDQGEYMCVLIEGQLEMYKEDSQGAQKIVAVMHHGKTIGEMAMVDGEPRSATAVVSKDVLLVMLTREKFLQISLEKPALATKMLLLVARMLSQRLRHTSGELVDFIEEVH
ncbi:MAG: cyclic nucleotide-binding domain-containing protein [Nitrosomonadales bacterium]|nr:cyclic nucleotide-binding domain-containing protein [Nitrosomonadales bacterium]